MQKQIPIGNDRKKSKNKGEVYVAGRTIGRVWVAVVVVVVCGGALAAQTPAALPPATAVPLALAIQTAAAV